MTIMRSRSSSPSRLANTVILTEVPICYFDSRSTSLQSHFASFGVINKWAPLRRFRRIMVVYESRMAAQVAKEKSDYMLIMGDCDEKVQLRVYRSDVPQPIVSWEDDPSTWIPSSSYLQPPPIEKNYLISPPGSPPKDWVQIKEDPPNTMTLAEDLAFALEQLELQQSDINQPLIQQLIDPSDGPGIGVFLDSSPIEEYSFSIDVSEEEWVYGETAPARQKWRPLPTAMPPIRMNTF